MFINKELANVIAREIEVTIPMYYNIMDSTGKILACTEKNRVDTRHEGIDTMKDNNEEEIFIYYDNQYPGCTMGVINSLTFRER